MDTVELSRRLGLAPQYVRARLHRLERSGVVRGYHAAVGPGIDQLWLIALRFPWTATVPTAERVRELPGVQAVHMMSSGWDYLLEADVELMRTLGVHGAACRGHSTVLGEIAVYEVWPIIRQYRRTDKSPRRLPPPGHGVASQ